MDLTTDKYFWVNYLFAAILIGCLLAFGGIVLWVIANCGAVPPAIWSPGSSGTDDFPYWVFLL